MKSVFPGQWRRGQLVSVRTSGFSMLELLVVMAIILVVLCMALPSIRTALSNYGAGNDARALAAQLSLTRMRAAAMSGRARLYCDPTASPQCRIQIQSYKSGPWTDDVNSSAGETFSLSRGNSFGIAPGAGTGAGGQRTSAPQQPPNATAPFTPNVAPYAIVFNSRGVPVDPDPATNNAKLDYALYIGGNGLYKAVTVDASARATVHRYDSGSGKYVEVKD